MIAREDVFIVCFEWKGEMGGREGQREREMERISSKLPAV